MLKQYEPITKQRKDGHTIGHPCIYRNHNLKSIMEILKCYPFGSGRVVEMIYNGHHWEFDCTADYNIKYASPVGGSPENDLTDQDYQKIENYLKNFYEDH